MRKLILTCMAAGVAAVAFWTVAAGGRPAADRRTPDHELIVSVAASLSEVMRELAGRFEQAHPGVRVRINTGASGTLQVQIQQGAPVDVFAGANAWHLDQLAAGGLLDAHRPRQLLCGNTLVMVLRAGLRGQVADSFQSLTSPAVVTIAIGDPAYVPAGKYATKLLESQGLYGQVRPKLVFASDVREALAWAETGAADAAIVYRTDAHRSRRVHRADESPMAAGEPIVYYIAITRRAGSQRPLAADFLDFVAGQRGRAALAQYGFTLPDSSSP